MKKLITLPLLLLLTACSTSVSTIIQDIDQGVNLAIAVYGLLGSPGGISLADEQKILTYINQANTVFGEVAGVLNSSETKLQKAQQIYNDAKMVIEPDLAGANVPSSITTELDRIQAVLALLVSTYSSGASSPSILFVSSPYKALSSAQITQVQGIEARSNYLKALIGSRLHSFLLPLPKPNSGEPPTKFPTTFSELTD